MFDLYPLFLLLLGIAILCFLILYLRAHAFLALLVAALVVGLLSPRVVLVVPKDGGVAQLVLANAITGVTRAFGTTMGNIGITIALATIIGKALMDSGGAARIVRAATDLLGQRNTPVALMGSGYVLGIPVFFDTVFLLLAPLAKALRRQTGKGYLLSVVAIGSGASITHSLVPPTPGPITVAATLGVDLGITILAGLAVAFPLAIVGLAYGYLINSVWPASSEIAEESTESAAPERPLPPLWLSLLPIVLPVLLISSLTAVDAMAKQYPGFDPGVRVQEVRVNFRSVLGLVGNANIALLLSALVSMGLVVRQLGMSRSELARFTASALDEAGMILLITSAGGAFGASLQAAGIGETLGTLAKSWGVPLLVLAWGVAALLKTAQGSATVAMITAASIVLAIVEKETGPSGRTAAEVLGYHPVYLVLAIGCGSKICSWMNDSGFWVVCKAGGLTEGETLRSWTVALIVMGLAGLPIVALLSWLVPMV